MKITLWEHILGFIWPPYGWQLRKQKVESDIRAGEAEWYREIYIPSVHRQSQKMLDDFKKPCPLKDFYD